MPATKQPVWEFIYNLGDANPLDFDGYFIYRDKTGVYPEEAEVLIRSTADDAHKSLYTIYRFQLERLKLAAGYLVPLHYSSDWPSIITSGEDTYATPPGVLDWWPEGSEDPGHAKRYDAWFHKASISFKYIALNIGSTTTEKLELAFTSADPLVRAEAYREIAQFHGWQELDPEPLTSLTRNDVRKRYRSELKQAAEKVITLKTMLAVMDLEEGLEYSGEELAAQGCYPVSKIPGRSEVVEIDDRGLDQPTIIRVVAKDR